MTTLEHARKILDTMLGYLGYTVQIEEENGPEGPTLQILTDDHEALVGPRGEQLEDMQYLLNRILQQHIPGTQRVRVDVEYYRSMCEDKLIERVKMLADRVRVTGQPVAVHPLNSYFRRIVHNTFAEDKEIMTVSHEGNARFKRMTLKKRTK